MLLKFQSANMHCPMLCIWESSKKVWAPSLMFLSLSPKNARCWKLLTCWCKTHKTLFVQKSNFPSFLEYILNLVKIGNLGSPDETAEARSHVLVRWITFQVCWKQVKNNANYFPSSDSPPWHCWVEVCQVRVVIENMMGKEWRIWEHWFQVSLA